VHIGTDVVNVMAAYAAITLMMFPTWTETFWSGYYKFNWFL